MARKSLLRQTDNSVSVQTASPNDTINIRFLRRPKTIIARFVAKHTARGAVLWGMAFAVTVASSATAFASLYTTDAARAQLAATFGTNTGLKIIFGEPHHIETVGGFTAWRSISVIVIIGAIWGILTSTKYFRGEEELGRMELFISGQTTARRATLNILAGLGSALLIIYLIPTLIIIIVGSNEDIGFSVGSCLFAGLVIIAGAAEFLAVGALTSQLAPVRKRAAAMAAAVFGLSFLTRAVADIDSNFRWLQSVSPLGWIEKLQPFTNPQPIWFLPIAAFVIILSGLAVYLSGRRDIGEGILSDRDTSDPRFGLLGSPIGLAWRESRYTILAWTAGVSVVGLLYGYLAKTAAEAIKGIEGITKAVGNIAGVHANIGAETIIGIMFLLVMVIMMLQATNLVGALREDEAKGYLDNLLVRPVSRLRWLSGRTIIIVTSLFAAGIAASIFSWLGETSQNVGLPYGTMFTSGLNVIPPAILLMSIGIFVMGFRPRLTTTVMYVLVAWSFLVEMIGSSLNLNHYILDTSILHHVALAPAVDPKWTISWLMIVISLCLIIAGTLKFMNRDIEGE